MQICQAVEKLVCQPAGHCENDFASSPPEESSPPGMKNPLGYFDVSIKSGQEPNGIKLGKAKRGGYGKFRYLQANNFVISTLFRA
jgi:hypothetical protein